MTCYILSSGKGGGSVESVTQGCIEIYNQNAEVMNGLKSWLPLISDMIINDVTVACTE